MCGIIHGLPFFRFDRTDSMLAIALSVLLVGVLVFLIYSAISIAFKSKANIDNATAAAAAAAANKDIKNLPFKASFDEHITSMDEAHVPNSPNSMELEKVNEVMPQYGGHTMIETAQQEEEAPITESVEVTPETHVQPEIPGSTREEVAESEPLQKHVSIKAESHSAMDPYEKNENVALFGSNLRHPEGLIEKTDPNYSGGIENEIIAGLASQVSKPTDLDKVQFSAEMAQNGGEFMNGIFAYDTTESGNYFSSL